MEEMMIMGKNAVFSRNSQKTGITNNAAIVGSSGSGKSVSIIEPFLLHTDKSSFICSVSKRRIVDEYIPLFESRKYKVIDLNFDIPEKSLFCFDPIRYLTSTEDIAHLSSALIMSDSRKANSKADPYWDSASQNLLNAIISMTLAMNENATMDTVLNNIDKLRINSGCNHIETTLDYIFDKIVKNDPYGFCATNWLVFSSLDSTKTASCIISSLQTMMTSIFTTGLRNQIAHKPCIDIEMIGKEKTALFITSSAMNPSLYTFVNILYGQIFKTLFETAQKSPDYKLPVHVSMLYDDFAIGGVAVKNFPEYTSIVREANMDFMILLQSESQLIESYGEYSSKTILNNIDTYCFLGCNDYDTAKIVSLKANIPVDEILWQPIGKALVFRRGCKPIFTERYKTYEDEQYLFLKKLKDEKPKHTLFKRKTKIISETEKGHKNFVNEIYTKMFPKEIEKNIEEDIEEDDKMYNLEEFFSDFLEDDE